MKCPHCDISFHPQFSTKFDYNFITKKSYKICHQFCPSCQNIIIGIYEYKGFAMITDEELDMKIKILK